MAALTNYLESAITLHFLGGATAQSHITQVFLGLYTSVPSEAGGGTEAAWSNYGRKQIVFDPISSSTGKISNNAIITFNANNATASQEIVAAGVFNAISGGNLLIYGTLENNKILATNDILQFAIAALELTLD